MIPMALALAPSIFKLGSGINQVIKGKRMNPVRPEYEIPDGITDNTAMFRARANTQRLPGQSMYENQIESGMAGNINALQQSGVSGAALAASANAMNSASAGSINQLANLGMQNQMQNQQLLAQANQAQAVYEDKAWDWNKKDKFQEEAAARAALLQAGNTQIYGAADDMASAYIGSPSLQAAGDNMWNKAKSGIQGFFQRKQARTGLTSKDAQGMGLPMNMQQPNLFQQPNPFMFGQQSYMG